MQEMVVKVKGEMIPENDRKYYVEFDKIRLIVEDGVVVGWYRPDVEE